MYEKEKVRSSVGGLIGVGKNVEIDNCHVSGKIIINGEPVAAGIYVGAGDHIKIRNSTSNVEITVNSENVFSELKKEVAQIEKIEVKKELINIIEEMESSKGTKSFNEHYKNFISRSADYMTLITPFLPKIAEFIQ